MKLITEQLSDIEYITEATESGKRAVSIKGVFMQADIKNRNGRVYPFDILNKEVKRYNKEFIKEGRAYGELGHPDGPTVNLDRVSHIITELYADGKSFIGEAKIASTPMGEIVKSLIQDGGKLGVSSRGMGSISSSGSANYVKEDFQLVTAADIVADPSAPSAFVEGIMEGKEWIWDNGLLKEKDAVSIVEDIERHTRAGDSNRDALAFAKFLKHLS